MTQANTTERKPLKGIQVGEVVSAKADKTRKVVVNYRAKAPKYGKFVKKRSIFHVHDENNTSQEGDTVEIAPCRRLSKTKAYRLVRIVEIAADRKHD